VELVVNVKTEGPEVVNCCGLKLAVTPVGRVRPTELGFRLSVTTPLNPLTLETVTLKRVVVPGVSFWEDGVADRVTKGVETSTNLPYTTTWFGW